MKPASQKLRVYEALYSLNQSFEQVLSSRDTSRSSPSSAENSCGKFR